MTPEDEPLQGAFFVSGDEIVFGTVKMGKDGDPLVGEQKLRQDMHAQIHLAREELLRVLDTSSDPEVSDEKLSEDVAQALEEFAQSVNRLFDHIRKRF